MSEKSLREIWLEYADTHKELMETRVKNDIEKYRKGYCKIKVVDKNNKPVANKKVKITQTKHAFGYGANIFMLDEFGSDELNKKYRDDFKKYFNTATVPFYWNGLEPEKGKPRFDKNSEKIYRRPAPELCVEYCEENGINPKLHCLVYDKFLPDWLPRQDMKEMEKYYEERIRQIAERYNGRFFEVEVINELLCESCWDKDIKSVISEKRDILEWAFGLARKYMPNETLVINEGNALNSLAKEDYRDRYFMMIDNALKNSIPIDKIGVQHHCFCGVSAETEEDYQVSIHRGSHMFDPSEILKGLDILAEFGLPLELTEITVPTFGTSEEDEELQAELLDLLYTTCFSHQAVETLVYWNLPDEYAYALPGWNENRCRGGLFRKDMTPKKSAQRLYEMFNKRWHTDIEVVTDENGYAEFRGFYGDYSAELDNTTQEFSIEKGNANVKSLMF